jgi:uncharacterized membrane protein YbhN (UPF0104 family)
MHPDMNVPEPDVTQRRSVWPRLAIGLACVVGVAIWASTSVDVSAVGFVLLHADLRTLLFKMPLLVVLVWLVRSIRWHLILIALGARPSFLETYLSIAVSLGLAAITPMQAGETLKIAHAKQHQDVALSAGTGGFLLERITDVAVLVAMTFVAGQFLLFPGINVAVSAFIIFCVGLVVCALLAWLAYRFVPKLIDELIRGARELLSRPALHLGVWITTISCWALTIVLWRAALSGVNIDVSFTLSSLLVGLVTLAGVALLVPGAIGVSEATVAALLLKQGFPPEAGLTGALALRLITFIAIGLGAVHWALARIVHRREQ